MAAIAAVLIAGAGIAQASVPTPAQFTAAADNTCLAAGVAAAAGGVAVGRAVTAYEAVDSTANRASLAGALAGFFLARWHELQGLLALPGPAASRSALLPYETDTWWLVATAKPFVLAVEADRAALVQAFATKIASLAAQAGHDAAAAGLAVCGAGRGYVIRLRFPAGRAGTAAARSLSPGAPVFVRGRGAAARRAGEVLAVARTRKTGGWTALVAIAPAAAPLHGPAVALVRGGGVVLTVGGGPALASDAILTGG